MKSTTLVCALAVLAVVPPAAAQDADGAASALPSICAADIGPAGMGSSHAGMDHGAMDHAMAAEENLSAEAPTPAHARMQQGMDAMHTEMMAAMANPDVDLAFVCGMIPHHQGAIAMAQAALEASQDPFVRQLAGAVLDAQQAEIEAMLAWLDDRAEAASD